MNSTTDAMPSDVLHRLFEQLRSRPRPEDVARLICEAMPVSFSVDRKVSGNLRRLAEYAKRPTSMSQVFARPVGADCFREAASYLFPRVAFPQNDMDREALLRYVAEAGTTIFRRPFEDYKYARYNRDGRKELGIEFNRFQYNRRFRFLVRIEEKIQTLGVTLEMEKLAVAANSRLAWEIAEEAFSRDAPTACYVTYLAARLSLRSVFTCGRQVGARDDLSEAMLKILEKRPETQWDVIAHVDPRLSVCERLDEPQKLQLLDTYMVAMNRAAKMLSRLETKIQFDPAYMVVQRGDDSTNWNLAAGAWNKTRDGWMGLVQALGSEALFDEFLPGKAQRLIAGDVAEWHRSIGSKPDPNTAIWAELPKPWDVMLKGDRCNRDMIIVASARNGMDPAKSGWIAARQTFTPASFSPTPELVHGVVVRSPQLASYLRSLGAFSGKSKKATKPIPPQAWDAISETRRDHQLTEEKRRETEP